MGALEVAGGIRVRMNNLLHFYGGAGLDPVFVVVSAAVLLVASATRAYGILRRRNK